MFFWLMLFSKRSNQGFYNRWPECLEQINSYDDRTTTYVPLKLIYDLTCIRPMLFDLKYVLFGMLKLTLIVLSF